MIVICSRNLCTSRFGVSGTVSEARDVSKSGKKVEATAAETDAREQEAKEEVLGSSLSHEPPHF